MRESQIESYAVQLAKKHGIYTRKFSSPAHKGVPDRIFIKDGEVLFIEFKAPGKKLTALQEKELLEILKHGVPATWVDSCEEVGACFVGIFNVKLNAMAMTPGENENENE